MDIGARFVENDAMVGSEGDGWVVVDRFGRRAADRISGLLTRRRRVAPLPGHASDATNDQRSTANNNNDHDDGNQASAMTKEDLWCCVQRMKQHSAPGDDGIPSDFYRAVAEDRRAHDEWLEFCAMDQGEPPPQPPIPMTKALLSVIRQQWAPA
jgi:hypothetical protein